MEDGDLINDETLCLFVTPWAVACQAPLSMEFSRLEYRSGLPFPSPGGIFLTQGSILSKNKIKMKKEALPETPHK